MRDALDVATINDAVAQSFPSAYADGMRCEAIGERSALARWQYRPDALRPGDYIPGPTTFALADMALWMAVFSAVGRIELMAVTSEMSIRFLRPAKGADLLARAEIKSIGSRRVVGTIELWVDGAPDRPIALAQGTYALP